MNTGSIAISVRGSASGEHKVTTRFTKGGAMVVFNPQSAFSYAELVNVRMSGKLLSGQTITDSFYFWVQKQSVIHRMADNSEAPIVNKSLANSTIVEPTITVLTDRHPSPGEIYIANMSFTPVDNNALLYVLDEHGIPKKQQLLESSHGQDFKRQPDGMLSYYDDEHNKYFSCDTNFNVVDSFEVTHGYLADGHELRLLPDGGFILLGTSETAQDMSQHITGGFYDANIEGSVIQEFDADHLTVFEWRGIDHFDILEATHENLTAPTIDFQHANSIEIDHDGNLLLSSRHLSEVTKIDRMTGDIIWRLGGVHNQFTFVNDSGFSYQHGVRVLPNGHLIMFDNGNYHTVKESRAVEYILDTTRMTATRVWEYRHDPPIYSFGMGYVDREENGNTLIGWGASDTTITEVAPDNSVVFEMAMTHNNYSYRAYKYPTSALAVPSKPLPTTGLHLTYINASQTLRYSVPSPDGHLSIAVTDLLGRTVANMPLGPSLVGEFSIESLKLRPGAYFCTLQSSSGTTSVRILLE